MFYSPTLLVLFGLINDFVTCAEWGYSSPYGPSNWTTLHGNEACDRRAQSPIDIPDAMNAQYDEGLVPFAVMGFEKKTNQLKLVNNGHTAQLNILGDLTVSGGGLSGTFKTAQLHFHWGSSSIKGSEHLRNTKAFPLEMHIVNFNSKYDSLGAAANKPDGLAVLGFWFKVVAEDNKMFARLVSNLTSIQNADAEVDVTDVLVSDLIIPKLDKYYRYKGSLTTPPCYESVTWTMFEQTIPISESQLRQFRNLKEKMPSHKIVNNFRPVQMLNGRRVSRSFKLETDGASTICSSSIVTVLLVYLLHLL
ncbi:carbonic anhydrase 2-like isoform X2 [Mytilus galloprovincialis]|uniref:carbonic anhydrase 2-like isoform X2 n=1 Tax=Mytilus galloprovincialis TaxID=29158 RepID=UPI003F7CBE19